MALGEVRSAAVPCAKASPVIAPAVLKLTSAVACCHRGLRVNCTGSPPSADSAAPGPGRGTRLRQDHAAGPKRFLRMACTCGFPGSFEFWNSTLASWATGGEAPTNHCWYTSATRAACPAGLVTGEAQTSGKPDRVITAADPVYFRQLAGLLSNPGCTVGLPLLPVRLAPPMMLLMARAAT